ncbi:thiol-activated cytolysin family protein [Algoriphagus sediminis]|uniref:Thiol-activated cytolysin family protein n=1 Tax=Algoriphagus sediminis TaxID=3057113 RepID=A0ABT7Y840_9BACT|nr:thiol-activated cytolysin family protein [Algoriphagus sediminis]MDN3202687.1 thiol-activated cytolysin family protein [Algoriphagus sediminis]
MKALFQNNLKAVFSLAFLVFVISSCDLGGSDEPIKISPDAQSITEYVQNLQADNASILNVQQISGSSQRIDMGTRESGSSIPGGNLVCNTTKYDLKNNFEDVAILRPTNGIIYPGAVVIADEATLRGLPTPSGISRAPMKLRVDLPGMGENGTLNVENPSNSSVQTSIDESLEWWNANAYQEGYVNAANSSYVAKTSYSSRQVSMDLGLNVDWAGGDVESQFNFQSTNTERVAMMSFKQVFYSVSMDPPSNPGEFFGPDASLTEVEQAFKADTPPAYVQSVSYGRIIMFRMTTTESATDAELEGAMNYMTGLKQVSGSVEAKYKSILNKSSITVVTIGGNAAVASEAVTAKNFADLSYIITGENAVYSRNNPGVPISYKLHYMKDNTTAKLGYTTEYEVRTCEENKYPARDISLNNKNGFLGVTVRFTVNYKTQTDGITYNRSLGSGDIKTNTKKTKTVPAGAYDIRLTVEYKDGLKWKFLGDGTYSRPTRVCLETTMNTLKTQIYLNTVGC